jgi:hypothetical protein
MTEPGEFSETDRSKALQGALAVEHLVAANEESNRTMRALVEGVKHETEARDRKVEALDKNYRQLRWVIVLVGFSTMVLMVIGVINAINLNSARKSNQQAKNIAAGVAATNQTLLDCVNSTGTCGQVNAANQAKILDTVKLYELTVLYCARTNPRDVDATGDKFLKCVNDLYPGAPQLDRRGE